MSLIYNKTNWKDDKTTPVNARNLNNIEDGVEYIYHKWDKIIQDSTTGDHAAELIDARYGPMDIEHHPTLGHRLNHIDDKSKQISIRVDNLIQYSSINVVTEIGLDNTGVEECGIRIQEFLNSYNMEKVNLYFPNGVYLWNSTVNTNKTIFLSGEKSNVLIVNTGNLACLKHIEGSCTINGLIFDTSSSNRNEFTIYSKNGNEFFCYDTTFTCSSGKINGLEIEHTTVSIIDRCKFNHSQISLKTWDCKISNTWVWALWRPYGIGIHGGCGNINMSNVDVVPPYRTDSGIKNGTVIENQKAGIWINSLNGNPTNNVIMENVYFDGNPKLDTGVGLLCENVFGITLSSYRANKMNSNVIVIDSSYNVIISKGMHFENNKYDHQAYEILCRNSIGSKMGDIVIDNCHFLNYVTSGITKPTPAIKVDSSADLTVTLTNNRICQRGEGYAYGNIEIDLISIPPFLYTNKGTKTIYKAKGSFIYKGTGTNLITEKPLAYKPQQKDYRFSMENGFTPNFRV
ncbi:MAG: hypothetical protein RSF67_04120, partial [Clostridia bacterium]